MNLWCFHNSKIMLCICFVMITRILTLTEFVYSDWSTDHTSHCVMTTRCILIRKHIKLNCQLNMLPCCHTILPAVCFYASRWGVVISWLIHSRVRRRLTLPTAMGRTVVDSQYLENVWYWLKFVNYFSVLINWGGLNSWI